MIQESTTHRKGGHAGRLVPTLLVLLVGTLGLLAPGCSFLSFGSYESFDAWYVGGKETVRAQDLGFRALDGNFSGYVVNDILIRTPVQFVLEATCIVLMPVALPYYGVRSLGGEGDPSRASEATPEDVPAEPGESLARS